MIGINEGLITTVEAPFGGLEESGLGKEGGHQAPSTSASGAFKRAVEKLSP